jgi:cellulose synthase/poly-beta-1,6-N-acetylglucosamine synthase-like glycosyltransferase
MGSGMMFPWKVIETAPLAGSNLVEDLRLGLDLASTGAPAYFFPFAAVTSQFPSSEKGNRSQRLRWIQGHLQTILSAPRLSLRALRSGNLALLILALDLAIPPLSLLGMLTIAYFAVATCFSIASGVSSPFILSIVNVSGMLLAVWLAFAKFGRPRLPDLSVGSGLNVIIGRLGLYGSMLLGRKARHWVRTDRT